MNPDIKQAVDIIDQRIANLQHIKKMLLEEFGVPGASAVAVGVRPAPSRKAKANGNETRKDELVRFLTEHGPSKRAKILAESRMPRGTVAYLLNQNDFVRRSDGTWDVRQTNASAPVH